MPGGSVVRLGLVCGLALVGCTSQPDGDSGESPPDCQVVVDRWIDIRQNLLDRLTELDADAASGPRRTAALSGTAAAILENSRDAVTLGCESAIESGSGQVCDRVAELTAGSGAAEDALAEILAACEAS